MKYHVIFEFALKLASLFYDLLSLLFILGLLGRVSLPSQATIFSCLSNLSRVRNTEVAL
jgi:hypothetical protein